MGLDNSSLECSLTTTGVQTTAVLNATVFNDNQPMIATTWVYTTAVLSAPLPQHGFRQQQS